MLKLKLQYSGHMMWRTDSLEKTLMLERLKAGGEGDDRGWDGWMASPTGWTWVWASSGSWWWTGKPGMLQSMGSQRVRHDWAAELNWTEGEEKNGDDDGADKELQRGQGAGSLGERREKLTWASPVLMSMVWLMPFSEVSSLLLPFHTIVKSFHKTFPLPSGIKFA